MRPNAHGIARLLISLAMSAGLLTSILLGARLASSAESFAAAPAWSNPPRDPEIGAIAITSPLVYDPAPGDLTRTVYFNNRQPGVISVTVTLTGTPPLTLTGAAAFSNTAPAIITSPVAPFTAVITYPVGIQHGSQGGVLFTAINSRSISVSVPVTFARDVTAPVGGISHPPAGWAAFSGLLPISGTAHDAGAGIRQIQVLTGTGGAPHAAIYSAPDASWIYTWALPFEDGVGHLMLVTMTDFVGNVLTATRAITLDNVAPTGTVVFSANLPVNQWTNTSVLSAQWTGFSDGGAIAGYQYLITNTSPFSLPSAAGTLTSIAQLTETLNDGQWHLHVAAQDAAGNWSATHSTGLFKVDTGSPLVSINAPAPGVVLTTVHLPIFDVSGVAADDLSGLAQVEVTTGALWSAAVGTSAWSYTWSLPVTDRQLYTLTARASDEAGNVGVSANVTVTLDTQAPSNPSIITTTNGAPVGVWSNINTIPLSWTLVSDGSGVTYYYTWTMSSTTIVGAAHPFTWNRVVTAANLPQGDNWFHLRSRDGVGNWATDTAHLGPFRIDLTPPTSTISAPSNGAVLTMTAGSVYTVSGVAGDAGGSGLAVVTVTVNGARLCEVDASPWACPWTIGGVDSTTFMLQSRARDNAGNLRIAPEVVSVVVDTVAPAAATPQAVGAPWTPTTTLVFTWSASSDAAGILRYELLITDTTAGLTHTRAILPPATQYISPTAGEGHGYRAALRAMDRNGNVGAWSSPSAVITPDVTGPIISYGAPPIPLATGSVYVVGPSWYYSSSTLNSVTLEVTATDNLSLAQVTASAAPAGWYGPIAVPMPPPTWRFLYGQNNVSLNPSGVLTITARDAAGRAAARTFTCTFDAEPPTAAIVAAPLYVSDTARLITVTYRVTDTQSGIRQAQVYYRRNGGSWTAGPVRQYGVYAQTISEATGVVVPGDGRYEWRATAVDNVGNTPGAPLGEGDRITFYDTTAPTTTVQAPPIAGAPPITLAWTAGDATAGVSAVALWVRPPGGVWGRTPYSDTTGAVSGTFAYVPTAGDGEYLFYVQAIDRAGNAMPEPTVAQASTTFGAAAPTTDANVPGPYAGYSPITVTWRATSTAVNLQAITLCISTTLVGWHETNYVYTGAMTTTAGGAFLFAPADDGRYDFAIAAQTVTRKRLPCPTSGPGSAGILYDTFIAAPFGLGVAPSGWTRTNAFTITWNNPADLSGIERAFYKTGAPPTSGEDGSLISGALTRLVTTAPGDGRHPVYVWLEDRAGNSGWTRAPSVTLRLDTVPPSQLVIQVAARPVTPTFSVAWSAVDATSGVISYTLEYSSARLSAWQLATSGLLTRTLLTVPFTDTAYLLRVTAFDAAGNSAQSIKAIYVGMHRIFLPVVLQTFPPPWRVGAGIDAGIRVYSLAACTGASSNTVYAGTLERGVYKSIDAGINWSVTALSTERVYGLAMPTCNEVYATTWGKGVYKSTDGGNSWTSVVTGLEGGAAFVYSIALDRQGGNALYLGTANGVYRSTDGGANWTAAGLAGRYVFGVSVDPQSPQTVYAALWTSAQDVTVYKTANGGGNWQPLGLSGMIVYIVQVDPRNSAHLLAATANGLYRSTDSGATWTQVGPAVKALWVTADAYSRQFFAGYENLGVWRSADGQTWTAFDYGLSGAARTVNAIEADAAYFYAGTNDRVWRYPRLP